MSGREGERRCIAEMQLISLKFLPSPLHTWTELKLDSQLLADCIQYDNTWRKYENKGKEDLLCSCTHKTGIFMLKITLQCTGCIWFLIRICFLLIQNRTEILS